MITPKQCKMARIALDLDLTDLAKLADVGINTVSRFENGMGFQGRTVVKLRSALEAAGVEFIPENGGGAGVRLRKKE
jgi:transcriptional regulator with XRE-family HTH domain